MNKYSNHKIAWFGEKLQSLREGIITAPLYVRIKPTNKCCHNCYFCVYRSELSDMHSNVRINDELSREKVLETLDNLQEMGVKAVTYSGGGEPLLHPDVVEMFEKTKANGIDLSVITNGQLLSGERADSLRQANWVRISIDYYDAKSFGESRCCTASAYNAVLDNIAKFAKVKNTNCDLSVNFIITKINFDHIVEAATLLKSLGIDNVRFAPVWFDNFVEYHADIKEEVMRGLEEAKSKLECDTFLIYHSYRITKEQAERSYQRCYIQETIPAIGADYNVYNCHNKSYDEDAIIGSIKSQTFKQMWFSEQTRQHFMRFNPVESCRCQCANDAKNKFIQSLMDCYGDNYV